MSLARPLALLAPGLLALPIAAQQVATPPNAPNWRAGYELSGTDEEVLATAIFDDGSGPRLYLGGAFTVAGTARTNGVASWDGERWGFVGSITGAPTSLRVLAMTVFDDGAGPRLVVGGNFQEIGGVPAAGLAAWDGTSWSTIGDVSTFGSVEALAVDGSRLYAGGSFSSIGGTAAANVAVLEDGVWSALGAGTTRPVVELTVATVAGVRAPYAAQANPGLVARFDGADWVEVPGTPSPATALGSIDVAGGVLLIGQSGGKLLAWNGSVLTNASDDAPERTHSLLVDDRGPTPLVYAGGRINIRPRPLDRGLTVWEGTGWSTVVAETPDARLSLDTVYALALGDLGEGERLFAAGDFRELGAAVVNNVAALEPFGSGLGQALGDGDGLRASLVDSVVFDDGSGPALYAGGLPGFLGDEKVGGLVRLEEGRWRPVGDPFDPQNGVNALAVLDDGSGPALYAIGRLEGSLGTPLAGVARWDGQAWHDVGGGLVGLSGQLKAAAVYDDGTGPALYVGGSFSNASIPAQNLARWDGTSWSAVGGGVTGGSWGIESLAVHDDGTGPKLYAGGDFHEAGGVAVSGLARWNGSTWEPVGSGINTAGYDHVYALESVDLAVLGGSVLVAGGEFNQIGGRRANGIGFWRDGQWHHLDHGFGYGASFNQPFVRAVHVFDDGSGPALYATGYFPRSDEGATLNHVARWTGTRWAPLRTGLGRPTGQTISGAFLTSSADLQGRGSLWVMGSFARAGRKTSHQLARWSRTIPPDPVHEVRVGAPAER